MAETGALRYDAEVEVELQVRLVRWRRVRARAWLAMQLLRLVALVWPGRVEVEVETGVELRRG